MGVALLPSNDLRYVAIYNKFNVTFSYSVWRVLSYLFIYRVEDTELK